MMAFYALSKNYFCPVLRLSVYFSTTSRDEQKHSRSIAEAECPLVKRHFSDLIKLKILPYFYPTFA
jgi:hypothetical protein